jgi:hypothetical protein
MHRRRTCQLMEKMAADLALFARLSAGVQLRIEDATADEWDASPFGWIRREPSRRKGAIGEALVKEWAAHEGMQVEPAQSTGHDCRLNGVRVEVKLSLMWRSGKLVFQQLRDQDYEIACLLGLEPQRVYLWAIPKPIIWERATGQHTGATAQDTRWLRFPAIGPPKWLQPYGGTLAAAKGALEQARCDLGR